MISLTNFIPGRVPILVVAASFFWSVLARSESRGAPASAPPVRPLAGTKPLEMQGDIASKMVAGVDKFLNRALDQSVEQRAAYWNYDTSSTARYLASVAGNQARLQRLIGAVDPRQKVQALELVGDTSQSALVGRG
jgi:hypothetical protein